MEEELTLFDLVSNINQWEDRTAVIFDGGHGTITMTYKQVMIQADMVGCS